MTEPEVPKQESDYKLITGFKGSLNATPTYNPRNVFEQTAFVKNGAGKYRVYNYIKDAWIMTYSS